MHGNAVRELRSGSTRIPGNQGGLVADRLRGCSAMLEEWRHIMQAASDHGSTSSGESSDAWSLARGGEGHGRRTRRETGVVRAQCYPGLPGHRLAVYAPGRVGAMWCREREQKQTFR